MTQRREILMAVFTLFTKQGKNLVFIFCLFLTSHRRSGGSGGVGKGVKPNQVGKRVSQ